MPLWSRDGEAHTGVATQVDIGRWVEMQPSPEAQTSTGRRTYWLGLGSYFRTAGLAVGQGSRVSSWPVLGLGRISGPMAQVPRRFGLDGGAHNGQGGQVQQHLGELGDLQPGVGPAWAQADSGGR